MYYTYVLDYGQAYYVYINSGMMFDNYIDIKIKFYNI